ncbi:MAG: tetratricopeptide repeat protein [Rhodospirillaceae bacterium]|nr:tetratricopeptide repeat protein [Rhodospirillaceae bacterium]MBT5192831.1 tetratricopeptide repeat protein [Rhodospirillaceae bacterium]MBT5896751.1 tetratricopeptide repeat protein [Rhodospirillaceae bacterium]MBT6431016.1 tetratricopeptide repeat protein [Rhodospirillaceae bacterium]MBT7756788.1 tetratricopeptide repeat protein [Rhodospirillaceae bacterium]
MVTDYQGLELTTESVEAADAYSRTVRSYLAFGLDAGVHMKAALGADSEMAMALITRGYFFHLFANPALARKAVDSAQAAEQAIAGRGANQRETWHLSALQAWNRGEMRQCVDIWERILLRYPHDALTIRLTNFMHFYVNGGAAMRQSSARVIGAWDEDRPDYGYILGVYAFSNEEAGDYAAAEAAGKRAVEINAKDIWATHAVAHVMEMQGRQDEGIAWLDRLNPEWAELNNFKFHTWWHLAMYHLEKGRFDTVLALYDGEFWAEPSDDYLDFTNAAAMLWRLQYQGIDVGDRWSGLADVAERHAGDGILAFADAHYMMALAQDGRDEAMTTMLENLEQLAQGSGDQAGVTALVGLPVCRATIALCQDRAGEAADILLPLRDRIADLGGSHAQRDVWAQMLCRALLDGGRFEDARGLLAQRTSTKANSPLGWRWYSEALQGCGDDAGAAAALANA